MDYQTFADTFKIQLNNQQQAALTNVDGQTLLLAVPGSGKTTTLVCCIGYMIYVHGIDPSKILVLTFTRAAAADMADRFASIFGNRYLGQIRFKTINGICDSALNEFCRVTNQRKRRLIEDNFMQLFRLYQECYSDYPAESDIKNMQIAITRVKNLRMTDREISQTVVDGKRLEPLYRSYQRYLESTDQMDYDDQLVFTYELLSNNREFLAYMQNMNPYILVDEAQDTSKIQHEIINLLAARHRHIFMVGDEDQSIYGFRAAYPEALLQFRSTYPDAHILKLERNYRSTPEIVTVANDFIRQNRNRYQKKMFTERPSADKVKFLKLNKREDQYHAIVHKLLPRYEGTTAVIYRNNESAIPLAVEMMKAGKQFICKGMDNVFFKSRVVSDICKIMQSALDPFNYSLMWETYSLFNAHVSRKAVYNATKTADQRRYDSLWYALYFGDDVSRNYKPVVKNIAQEMAAIRANNNAKDAIARICSMGYKRADDDKVFILRTLADNGESIESFISRLRTLEFSVPSGSSGRGTPYIFTTIHSSKGLEYDNVIIMDEIDPIFPDKRMDLEEERRLFYVAVTRAKNNLALLSYGNEKQPFIDDIQRSLLAGNRKTGAGNSKAGSGKDKASGSNPKTGTTRRPDGKPVKPKYGEKENGAPSGTPITDKSYFRRSASVVHKLYGAGIITDVSGDIATIRYSDGVVWIYN